VTGNVANVPLSHCSGNQGIILLSHRFTIERYITVIVNKFMVKCCVLFEVRSEFLNISYMSFGFKW
jgi:hypothetical protein